MARCIGSHRVVTWALGALTLACGNGDGGAAPKADASSVATDAAQGECTSHADCIERNGAHFICQQPERRCTSLLSSTCTSVTGDDTEDDAVFVGVLAPKGNEAPLFEASDLARQDFTDAVGGLPSAESPEARAFVMVRCAYLGDDPLPSARHLVESVRVPAIVGPPASAAAISVAQNVAIPSGVVVMSPSAQSDVLSELADDDLLFRTNPTTKAVAPQLAAMVADAEAAVRSQRGLDEVKVALVSARDAYGIALSTATADALRFNDGSTADQNEERGRFLAITYDATETNFEREVARRVVAFEPTIIVLLTAFRVAPLRAIEAGWADLAVEPPYYVMDAGAVSPEHRAYVASRPDSLRARIRIAMYLDPERPAYRRYVKRASPAVGDATLWASTASIYDATYALAFAIVAAESPLTGKTVARGVRRLVNGETIEVFPERIEQGVRLLSSGADIDLEGASGALDFDEHGDVAADGSVSCFVRDPETDAVSVAFGGQTYDATTKQLEGTFRCE